MEIGPLMLFPLVIEDITRGQVILVSHEPEDDIKNSGKNIRFGSGRVRPSRLNRIFFHYIHLVKVIVIL